MTKKNKSLFIPVDAALDDKLLKYTEKHHVTAARAVKDVVKKYLLFDEGVIPVLLKIPANLDPVALKTWLDTRVTGIVTALTKKAEARLVEEQVVEELKPELQLPTEEPTLC